MIFGNPEFRSGHRVDIRKQHLNDEISVRLGWLGYHFHRKEYLEMMFCALRSPSTPTSIIDSSNTPTTDSGYLLVDT